MTTEMTIDIYAPDGKKKNHVVLRVPVKKLAIYSSVAKHHYFPGTQSTSSVGRKEDRSDPTHTEFNLGAGMYGPYAQVIGVFIKNADVSKPALVTADLFPNIANFTMEGLVQMSRVVSYGYKVPQGMYDKALRDRVRTSIYQRVPLTLADYKYVAENLAPSDKGMLHTVMDHAAILHIKGRMSEKTAEEIRAYCESVEDWWDQQLETLTRVLKKEEGYEKRKADAARKDMWRMAKNNQESSAGGVHTKPRAKQGNNTTQNTSGRGVHIQARDNTNKQGGMGKGKGKGKKSVAPFEEKEGDFPAIGTKN